MHLLTFLRVSTHFEGRRNSSRAGGQWKFTKRIVTNTLVSFSNSVDLNNDRNYRKLFSIFWIRE